MSNMKNFLERVAHVQKCSIDGGLIVFLQSYGYMRSFKEYINSDIGHANEEESKDSSALLGAKDITFWEQQGDSAAFTHYSQRIK